MRTNWHPARARRGITLLEILIAIALLALLVVGVIAIMRTGGTGGAGGTGTAPAAATQLVWITKPESFEKNTPTTFEIELQRYRSGGTSGYAPYGGQETLVGVVLPASVSIQSINGEAPSTPTAIPSTILIPGLSGGGTAHPTVTSAAGRIVFVLNGTEPADGQLTVIYVRADGNHTVETITFSVTD